MRSLFRKRKNTATSVRSPKHQVRNILCPVCKNLDPNFFEVLALRSPRLRLNLDKLQESANTCLGCNLVLNVLERHAKVVRIPSTGIRLVYDGTIWIEMGSSKEIMLYSDRATPWSSITVRDHVTGPNYSERSLRYVKNMLQTCSNEHDLCRRRESVSLPTRLLDLGCENDTIRLWETKSARASSTIEYACLSHCWGEGQPVKTLNENYEEHKKMIRPETLPRTFLDAIDFTRRLGIRYIWIDSLWVFPGLQFPLLFISSLMRSQMYQTRRRARLETGSRPNEQRVPKLHDLPRLPRCYEPQQRALLPPYCHRRGFPERRPNS